PPTPHTYTLSLTTLFRSPQTVQVAVSRCLDYRITLCFIYTPKPYILSSSPAGWRDFSICRDYLFIIPKPKTRVRKLMAYCTNSRSEEHTSELQSRENLVC